MAARDDLEASPSIERRIVDGRPDLENRFAIEAPELSAVLMPGQIASASLGRLVEHTRAVDRHGVTDHGARDASKKRRGDVRAKGRIELELLDFAISERRAFVAATVDEIAVAPALGVALEEHALVGDLTEHDRIGACRERARDGARDDLAEARIATFSIRRDRALDVDRAQRT